MAVGDFGDQARPAPTPPVATRQLGLDSRLVQEDEARAHQLGRLDAPALAGRYDIRPVLFGGVQDFFLPSGLSGARRARLWTD